MTRRRPTHERSQALHRILAILRNGDRTARERHSSTDGRRPVRCSDGFDGILTTEKDT